MEKNALYVQFAISVANTNEAEILVAQLLEMGMEGFEEQEGLLLANGPMAVVDTTAVEALLAAKGFTFSKTEIANQNWNAIWETSFEPVLIENFAGIRAGFHSPLKQVQHEIIITPKMSFGTGHHATTWLMVKQMATLNLAGRRVLDFGTGTGVLAILASKLGAAKVVAIDNDEWSMDNAGENITQNETTEIELKLLNTPPMEEQFDVILANINKHVIIAECHSLAAATAPQGMWVLSGLLTADEQDIVTAAARVGMKHVSTLERNGWISLICCS